MPPVEALVAAAVLIFLFGTILAACALVVVSLRTPQTIPLAIAGALVLLALIVVAVVPVDVPPLATALLALPAVALAVIGGNPVTRRILDAATHGRVRETDDGGIVAADAGSDARVLLRGGTTIGYLERLAVALAVLAGFPEAIAVVVAVKGIGRFPELAASDARERFIIGTLASLLWACAVAGVVRLTLA